MSETIVAALISAGVTLIVCIINSHLQSNKIQALIEYRLDILEKKQDQHNEVIERVYKLEQDTAVQAEQITNVIKRIDETC